MKNINKVLLIIVFILSAISAGLFYYSRTVNKNNAILNSALTAATDTLHTFKTDKGATAGYISTIEGDNKTLTQLLSIKSKENQNLITLLDTNKTVVTATEVKTKTIYKYISEPDTVFKGLKFSKLIQNDKWITERISIDSNKLSRNLEYRDELVLHSDKKDNKGWFTGSTLTTYAEPQNPNTTVTGLTSISTVVDKRKPRLGSFLGPSLSIDRQGNVKAGISLGVGLTF